MIDEEKTFDRFGYTSDQLSKWSKKRVIRLCDKCGREKEIRFDSVNHLCQECGTKEYFEKQSSHDKLIQAQKKRWDNPDNHEKMSVSKKNSDATKRVSENQKGGHDIIQHHIIYDHDDLSKFTISLTRSAHTTLHNEYRKNGYQVPHINEVNII